MLQDFQLPPEMTPPPAAVATRAGVAYERAAWTPAALGALAPALERGAAGLRALADEELLAAWSGAVDAFLDPAAAERRSLAAPLAALCGLSRQGLDAGLEAVLGGVRRAPAGGVLAAAAALRAARGKPTAGAPVLVVLAANLPALAVQPLLPALALRRPVLLKSPSAEPLFAPAFVQALVRRAPRLASAVAAVSWPGGDKELEAPLLAAAGQVLAYGGAEALADLERRAPGKVVAYGPRTSVAVVDPEGPAALAVSEGGQAEARPGTRPEMPGPAAGAGAMGEAGEAALERLSTALARDVALFDQRGCLSVAAVYLAGDLTAARRFARHLEEALGEAAVRWPPGPAPTPTLAAVQQLRLEAELRGLPPGRLPPAAGTVLVEPDPVFRPSPGCRTVRIHPLADLDRLPGILAPWRGRLQGAALAGSAAWRLAPRLAALGISRCAPPGQLQSPDAAWHNGGIDPLGALAG